MRKSGTGRSPFVVTLGGWAAVGCVWVTGCGETKGSAETSGAVSILSADGLSKAKIATGRLLFKGADLCGASHMGDGLVLTAGHCLMSSASLSRSSCADFSVKWDSGGTSSACSEVIHLNTKPFEDYALLRVSNAPSAQFGKPLTTQNNDRPAFFVSGGQGVKCTLAKAGGTAPGHYVGRCDSMPGQSGTLVFSVTDTEEIQPLGLLFKSLGNGAGVTMLSNTPLRGGQGDASFDIPTANVAQAAQDQETKRECRGKLFRHLKSGGASRLELGTTLTQVDGRWAALTAGERNAAIRSFLSQNAACSPWVEASQGLVDLGADTDLCDLDPPPEWCPKVK